MSKLPPPPAYSAFPKLTAGFTLIELSIVLVIIGLIVGGILVGQDLIKAAEVRAQISQIEKFNTATNTFKIKFGAIPGDMPPAIASQFGFVLGLSCDGSGQGKRDGNGLLDGGSTPPLVQNSGETGWFWWDISGQIAGNLIEGSFPGQNYGQGYYPTCNGGINAMNISAGANYIGNIMPLAKIGHGNFAYVYSNSGYNWFGVSQATAISAAGNMTSGSTIPVIQAYNMDKKADDGLPLTGAVQATFENNNAIQFSSGATTDSTTTCYNTTSNAYSVSSLANYGAGGNCALSFRFQ